MPNKSLPDKAVNIHNPDGAGPLVILCEHASHYIPAEFNDLGLAEADRTSHAAWDPGALGVAQILADLHDAPLIAGTVSRLVYDCNRPPEADSAMPIQVEKIMVPGNRDLTETERSARIDSVYRPYCDAVSKVLDARDSASTILVTIHSFTPIYFGNHRAVEIGILHDTDTSVADTMLAAAAALPHRSIQRNQPYGPQDGVTHSLRLHAITRDLPNVMIEVRNDLLTTLQDQTKLAHEVNTLLRSALPGKPHDA